MPPSRLRVGFAFAFAAATIVLALSIGCVASPRAHAASAANTISFSPTSGPVGTTVQVSVIPPASMQAATTYALSATMTDPASGGCSSAQPIPGAGAFTVGSQGGGTTFDWPAALSQGPYWLCASPTGGSGTPAASLQQFTVLAPDASTPMPTPYPTVSGTLTVYVPPQGVLPGATFTAHVANWSSPMHDAPQGATLTLDDPATPSPTYTGFATHATVTPRSGTGNYVITVTVPTTIYPGMYWLIVGDQRGRLSAGPFKVLALEPTATPVTAIGAVTHPTRSGFSPATAGPIAAAVLLALIIVGTLTFGLLRRRAGSATRR